MPHRLLVARRQRRYTVKFGQNHRELSEAVSNFWEFFCIQWAPFLEVNAITGALGRCIARHNEDLLKCFSSGSNPMFAAFVTDIVNKN